MEKLCVLENAVDAVETERLNNVSELRFALPVIDVKNSFCQPFRLVRWDNGPFYRLLDIEYHEGGDNGLTYYTAEHVIATLIDTVMFGTLQLDNLSTRACIERILARQSTQNWVLGQCDFDSRLSYSWSNENLLVALLSIPNRFEEDWKWEYDTSTWPWKLHLRRLSQNINPELYIRDGRNLLQSTGVNRGRDICNRIYALGYGEGVNQLTIAGANAGVPYVEDRESIAQYGLIERIWEDSRFEDPQAMKERAEVLLKGYSKPYETWQVEVADLDKMTNEPIDRAEAGKIVQFGDLQTWIVTVERHLQEIGQDSLELANAPEDIVSSISDLADRQRINSVYAQGATCLYSQAYNDNADATHPATIRFYVPSEARQINKVVLSWQYERFRAYSTGAESNPAATRSTSAGGATRRTSSDGGSDTVTSTSQREQNYTSTSTTNYNQTSVAGGGGTPTTTSIGENKLTSYAGGSVETTTRGYETSANTGDADPTTSKSAGGSGSHTHGISHKHSVLIKAHTHDISISDHRHDVLIPGHSHTVNLPAHSHQVTIPGHNHQVTVPAHSHNVNIRSHTHTVDLPDHQHTVDIPGHTHATIYGIHEGPAATACTLRVDGVEIPLAAGQTELDIAAVLGVDAAGKIRRGTFHTIEIIPNSLTRITATLTVQLFIQSEGGGLY